MFSKALWTGVILAEAICVGSTASFRLMSSPAQFGDSATFGRIHEIVGMHARTVGVEYSSFLHVAYQFEARLPRRCLTSVLLPSKKLPTRRTSCPLASRRSQKCEPKKPSPPEMRILFTIRLSELEY